MLRNCDGREVTEQEVLTWPAGASPGRRAAEVPFKPARVLLQDFTGVPRVVDLAAMRDAMKRLGGDPGGSTRWCRWTWSSTTRCRWTSSARPTRLEQNVAIEFQRNRERYEFLRWGQKAFANFRVVPPGSRHRPPGQPGVSGQVVFLREDAAGPVALPDTLVGTDSHTTMINGLGVLGWGVGGIEAEAVHARPATLHARPGGGRVRA